MTTRELISSLPENIVRAVESYRTAYSAGKLKTERPHDADYIRSELYGYVKGLRDSGAITENQRKILYVYCITVGYNAE